MSVFDNINQVEVIKPRGSYQDLSHSVKLTTEVGRLTPTCCFLLAPGEKVRLKSDFFCRLAPMYAPLMDNFDIYSFWFADPWRLEWADLQDFITGGVDGDLDDTLYPTPKVRVKFKTETYVNRAGEVTQLTGADTYKAMCGTGSLADYLGMPVPIINPVDMSTTSDKWQDTIWPATPFRVYHRIWNDYFRNQNIEPEEWEYVDGDVHDLSPVYARLRYKNFNKDYFTSALPNTQLGDTIPLVIDSQVVFDRGSNSGDKVWVYNNTAQPASISGRDSADDPQQQLQLASKNASFAMPGYGTSSSNLAVEGDNGSQFAAFLDNSKSLKVNSSVTINNLRAAIAVQEFQELNARAGHRYIEYILAQYGVYSQDARLQRPEFLGGCSTPVNVSAVLQNSAPTSETDSGVLGSYAGYGQAVGNVPGVEFYTASEYTWIMNIICVVPHNSYMQGLPKHLDIQNRFDLPIPLLAGLGEQPILNKEVFFDCYDNSDRETYNNGTFGYTARYNQYRFLPDSIHGDFRETLNTWHLARLFSPSDRPELNAEFIKINPDEYNRVFNVTSSDFDHFMINIYHSIDAFRKIPRLGTPKLSANPSNMTV